MKSVLIGSMAALLLTAGVIFLGISPASAWQYNVQGSGQCVDGLWKVTWTIDNSSEAESLYITQSDRAVIATPLLISAHSKFNVNENVIGDVTLTVGGNWLGDRLLRTESATVKFNPDCRSTKTCEDTLYASQHKEECTAPAVPTPVQIVPSVLPATNDTVELTSK